MAPRGIRYAHLIERSVRLHRPRPAVICGDVTRSFGTVYERACRLASALAAMGAVAGDRIAVLAPNCAEYMEIDIALARAGYVRVSLNVRATGIQQEQVVSDSGSRFLIYADALADAAERIMAATNVDGTIRLGGDDYEDLLQRSPSTPPEHDPAPDDLYCLFYTSGTTGRAKGVMLTHAAYMAAGFNLLLEFGPVEAGEKIVLPQPLSHGGGFFMLPWFISGATCVVMERYTPEGCLDLIERHAAATVKVVPTMLLQMLDRGLAVPDLPALKQVIYGASPIPAARLRDLIHVWGPIFKQLYGQSEAPMTITVLGASEHVLDDGRLLTSAGRPWRNLEVRIVDEDRRDVETGEIGEVIVAGPHLMAGYWNQPELTQEVLRDGYVHTRDMARADDEGYIYLLGRTDDMIISGGFNVAPRLVEEVLNRHPAVHESFVLGMPHATLGEQVTAVVTMRPGVHATPGEILDSTHDVLGFEKPRSLQIVPELPRNAYGKVDKKGLRELLGAENESA
jgi:acyl-CoA synthetase (AMP-forming)/AMP-acid ligase II